MKNKIAALVAGTILSLTAGSVPSYALNVRENFVSNSGRNSETINLDNGLNQTSDRTITKQVEADNGEVLIAGRQYRNYLRRRNRRRRFRRFNRRFRRNIMNRGIYRRSIQRNNRRRWRRVRPVPGYYRNRPVRRYRYRR